MEKCYEYFGCKQTKCPAYQSDDDIPCWDIDKTLCNNPAIKLVTTKNNEPKESACLKVGCIYYKKMKEYVNLTSPRCG